jgi:hypothetical protein
MSLPCQFAPTTVPTFPENPPRIPFLISPMIIKLRVFVKMPAQAIGILSRFQDECKTGCWIKKERCVPNGRKCHIMTQPLGSGFVLMF